MTQTNDRNGDNMRTIYLEAGHIIDSLSLSLDEDCYGEAGVYFDDDKIRTRLLESIVKQRNYRMPGASGRDVEMSVATHENMPALTLSQVADILLDVWRYWERRCVEAEQRADL